MPVTIVILNLDSEIVTQEEIVKAAEALTLQVQNEFAEAWNVTARVRAGADATDRQPGEWPLVLKKSLGVADALGYHTRTPDGAPVMYASPELDRVDGSPWTVTASHEIMETLADAWCAFLAPSNGVFDYVEVADRVEQDTYQKTCADGTNVMVSNFSLPEAFAPPDSPSPDQKWDYLGYCTHADEVRPGGYQDSVNSSGVQSRRTHPDKPPRGYRMMTHDRTRRARRVACAKRVAAISSALGSMVV